MHIVACLLCVVYVLTGSGKIMQQGVTTADSLSCQHTLQEDDRHW